jgi:hypothetical protein
MSRARFRLLLAAASIVPLAGPAAADQVLTYLTHTDEMSVMGQKTPAQDVTQEYWFGASGVRFDAGPTTVITRADQKKLYFLNHDAKTFSAIDLPFDLKSLVGPEMAPMMDQMMAMMKPSLQVTETDRTGAVAGFACKHYQVSLSMGMVQMATDTCASDALPVDFAAYRALRDAQGELLPNSAWMKELTAKVQGLPLRSDTTTTMMGSSFKSWQELKSLEDRPAPAGHYEPPTGYREVQYDPMSAARQGQR